MPLVIVRAVKQYFYFVQTRVAVLAAIGIGCLFFTFSGTHAQAEDDMFTVHAVPIETSGASGTEARNTAMYEIEAKAFRVLLKQLTPDTADTLASTVSRSQITQMVQGIAVDEEKFLGNQYKALMSVSFSPTKVHSLIGQAGSRMATIANNAPPLLLPVYFNGPSPVLMEGDNPWKTAWNSATLSNSFRNVSLPVGDLEDITLTTADMAAQGDYTLLQPIAGKYHTSTILVAVARLEQDPASNSPVLNVILRKVTPSETSSNTFIFHGQPGQNLSDLMTNAVSGIINQTGKPQTVAQASAPPKELHPIDVIIPFNNLGEWTRIRQHLKNVRAIEKMQIKNLGARYVNMVFYSRATQEELSQQFQKNGFSSTVSGNNTVLHLMSF